MTATTAADGCEQTGYKYEVPDNLAKDAKVIFTDGGSQQYPGIPPAGPGLQRRHRAAGTAPPPTLAAVECETTSPGHVRLDLR